MRQYDPTLIWGYIGRYADERYPDRMPGDRITVFFYVAGKSGAYYMRGPKLYWDEEVGDGYFANTNQTALADNSDSLREVVIYGLKKNREAVMFPTYAEFLSAVGFQRLKTGGQK